MDIYIEDEDHRSPEEKEEQEQGLEAEDEQQYQKDFDDDVSDSEIFLEDIKIGSLPRRKESLSNVISQARQARGLMNESTQVAVHNLTYSVDMYVTKHEHQTILSTARERWHLDKKEKTTRTLLNKISFVIQRKMMCLLLGPPGSGKTTLMKLLANEIPYGRARGDIFFNKKPICPETHHRLVSYVMQEDEHLPTLTVRQTLEFATLLLNEQENLEQVEMTSKDVVDMVLQLLGLSHRADTIVGNAMIRGVSGGEKKRVTIGLELIKAPRLLLLDEATTGLDTAKSIELGKFCRIMADHYVPVVAALLQPPLRLYKRFDHILLLHEGETAYFGPRSSVLEYFEEIGFRCPHWMNPADFLVAVLTRPDDFRIDTQQDRLVDKPSDFAVVYRDSALYRDIILPQIQEAYPEGIEPEEEQNDREAIRRRKSFWKKMKTRSTFSEDKVREAKEGLVSSPMREDVGLEGDDEGISSPFHDPESSISFGDTITPEMHLNQPGEIRPPAPLRKPNLTMDSKASVTARMPDPDKFATSGWFQFRLLVRRGFLSLKNFPAMIIVMSLYSLFLAVFYGTLFFQLGYSQSDITLRYGIVFNIVLIMGFKGNAANDFVFQGRRVFQIQRSKRYFSTLPFWAAGIVNYVPSLTMDVALFATVAYWLVGLSDEDNGGRFLFLILVGIFLTLAVDGWVRTIAQLNSDYVTSQGMAPFTVGVLLLCAGFFRRVEEIPWIARWIAYISPFRWAYEALVANELQGTTFTCKEDELVPPESTPGFYDDYSNGGFEEQQVCPVTSGDDVLKSLDISSDPEWKWYCLLFLAAISFWFQLMSLLGLKFIRHHKPPLMRVLPDDDKGPSLIPLDEFGSEEEVMVGDLESQREAKPRVTVIFNNLSYSVPGRPGEIESEDEEIEMENAASDGEEIEKEPVGDGDGMTTIQCWNRCREKNPCTKCCCCQGGELRLLNDISGRVEPGMMIALMGPSGAGKSTLLDVIAGRKTGGTIEGEILFNGRPRDEFFSRYTGYCEQQDLHMDYATVWEAVRLSALTRLPTSWSRAAKLSNVRLVIDRLHLTEVARTLVKDLRLEQRKKLTVAVELVTNPSVLFLDEPTSGLDATEAAEMMRVVKQEAENGMSVCCTIHQPSSQIFALFTHVILLRKGGEVLFVGPSSEMKEHFRAHLGLLMPSYENPADFALEVASRDLSLKPDAVAVWRQVCSEREVLKESSERMSTQQERMSQAWTAEYHTKYPASFYVQCREIVGRSAKSIFRRPVGFQVRVIRNLLMGLLAGAVFYDLGSGQTAPGSTVASFFFLLIIATFNAFTQITMIMLDRPAFYRERLAGSYRALVYLAGLIVPDLPFQALSFTLFILPQYFLAGFKMEAGAFFYFFICGFGASVLSFSVVNLIALVAINAPLATIMAGIFITLANMLAGFFIPKSEIPVWWIWGYYTSFVRYPLEGLATNELSGLTFNCDDGGAIPIPMNSTDEVQWYCPIQSGDVFLDQLHMDPDHKWPYLAVTYGLIFVLTLLCWLALVKIIHLNR